jgi:hypothetical protein
MMVYVGTKLESPNRRRAAMAAWRRGVAVLLLAGAGFSPAANGADVPGPGAAADSVAGPTIRLDYGGGEKSGNPASAFMYFVPLISPEPVTAVASPGSKQWVRVTSATRHQSGGSFTTTCDLEFSGDGSHQNIFDLARDIQRHGQRLKAGGKLGRRLHCITVTGRGRGRVEVKGTVTKGVESVTEVRLRFNAQGQTSPVAIELCDIRYLDGDFRLVNALVARVNTLTFGRKPGPPKMEVGVSSIKSKSAGNGLWQNLRGSLAGAVANLLIDPLTVEALGHRAMLDFGQALAVGAPSFTFPRAKNLKESRP